MFQRLFSRRPAIGVVLVLLVGFATRPAGQPSAQPQPSPSVSIPSAWTPGFANEISGEVISYPSAYPGQLPTLLTRATDGRMRIEWEAQAPPPGAPEELLHFVWHAGLASGYGAHRFTFSVNGTPCATFASGHDTNDRQWSVPTTCGGTLAFETTKVGNFNELFGLMMLSIPRRLVAGGKPRFAAVGEAAGTQDYYLVFMRPLEEFVRVTAEQARLTGGRRALRVEISRIADEQPARVVAGDSLLWSGSIAPGYTSLFVPLAQSRPEIAVEIGGKQVFDTTIELKPVRPWQIHLLPHSHVDIGYSDPQPEVERKQWKNLRDAVDLARKTASYPPGARFRWNVEGLWSVESYLRQAGEPERRAFVEAVKSGAIGLQANYTNILTGLASPEELAHWTDAARQLRARYGFAPIRSAMHTDIPGLSWSSVQPLVEGGVRYFSSGPNYMPSLPDGGDRIGGTLAALGDKPFWWVSPSGRERILFWMAGRGYSWFHGMNAGSLTKSGRTGILDYVRELDASGYRWNMVQVRYTVGGDNGPVDPALPDAVKEWNETFDSPKLVIDTAEAMFAEFERRYGRVLPSRAGDMTPYWEDGALSSAAEEAMVRASARRLVQAETLWCLRDSRTFPVADGSEAWRNVLLWHEHTWGAADSISQPDRADVVGQWTYKRQFAVQANAAAMALVAGATASSAPRSASQRAQPPTDPPAASEMVVEVANTLSWTRSGVVYLPPAISAGRDAAFDREGMDPLPSQRMKDDSLAVFVKLVPPLGSRRLVLRAGAIPANTVLKVDGTALDNGLVRLTVDATTGNVRSLRSKSTSGSELVNTAGETNQPATGLNAYLYVPGRDPATAQTGGAAKVSVTEAGPVVARIEAVHSGVPGARRMVRQATVVLGSPVVALETTVFKEQVRTKESAHLAFPFNLDAASIHVDEGSAIVVPDRNQLPGSCRDFIGVHSAVDLANRQRGVMLASLDAPLVEVGAMTDERQDSNARVRSWRTKTAAGSTVYAYLLNNYWHTNYKADQDGPLTYRFALQPHEGGPDDVALRRFGAEQEQPLIAYAVSAAAKPARASFSVEGAGVVVASVRAEPDEAGNGTTGAVLVRLYNPSTKAATARVVPRGTPAQRVTGQPELTLPPFGTAVVRVGR